MFEALRAVPSSAHSTRVIYEDFVTDTRRELDRILDGAGLDLDRTYPFLGDGWVDLEPMVLGNPMRFTSGHTQLRVDAAWHTDMPSADRRTVTAITAPMLAAYGYLGRRRERAVGHGGDGHPRSSTPAAPGAREHRDGVEAVRGRRRRGVGVRPERTRHESLAVHSSSGPAVRVITNTRVEGLAGARNSGITAATGDLIAFCDDDDERTPDKLAVQVPALQAAPGTPTWPPPGDPSCGSPTPTASRTAPPVCRPTTPSRWPSCCARG